MHAKDKGKMGEAVVIQQALEHGCAVFPEFGDNSKIDLVLEDSTGKLHRVQVKTYARTAGSTKLYFYKSGPNYSFTYDDTMIDWFAVVDEETKAVAWINSSLTKTRKRSISLRHDAPKKIQQYSKELCWFKDFTKFPF